ncbi:MAG: nucleic acid-binding protein [Halobacteria archaeon]|nr:nucleic acid-binding protein [Halobacteria archaeon]
MTDLVAGVCGNGHVTYPKHSLCPECGEKQTAEVDLSGSTAEVVTWTESTATPPGVREPNLLVVVEFEVEAEEVERDASVRAVGQVADGVDKNDVEMGARVEPVEVDRIRDPDEAFRDEASQDWDGYRYEPI